MPGSKTDIDPFYAALGKRLAALRKRRGYTQKDVGKLLGVVDTTITYYEMGRNRMRVREFHRYCMVLGENAADVLASAVESMDSED